MEVKGGHARAREECIILALVASYRRACEAETTSLSHSPLFF